MNREQVLIIEDDADIREGVRRLSTVVNAEKEMVDMFGTASIDEAGAGSHR